MPRSKHEWNFMARCSVKKKAQGQLYLHIEENHEERRMCGKLAEIQTDCLPYTRAYPKISGLSR
jgi:hypothetical protein